MMLRAVYKVLLRLQPEKWRAEMLNVFDEAQVDAREQGWLAYVAFAARELTGLVCVGRSGAHRGRWSWATAGLVAGLAAGWAVTLATPEMYTSQATIRALPGARFLEPYLPTSVTLTVENHDVGNQSLRIRFSYPTQPKRKSARAQS